MSIDTKKVKNRREVHYSSYDDFLADAERLATGETKMLGNWTLGQAFGHLANSLNFSIDGFPGSAPWPMKIMARLFMRKMMFEGPLKPGFKLPKKFEDKVVPGEMSSEDGIAALRTAIGRVKSATSLAPHPAFGKISADDWTRANLRHAELHMSFAVPA